eukprot:1078202-Pleurochrysis_carterae.AAC.6
MPVRASATNLLSISIGYEGSATRVYTINVISPQPPHMAYPRLRIEHLRRTDLLYCKAPATPQFEVDIHRVTKNPKVPSILLPPTQPWP